MTTSNSIDFTLDGGQIIDEAFSLLGIKTAASDLEPEQIQDGLTSLNLMLKGWQAQGLHLWTEEEGILFLDVGKENYLLGPNGDESTTFDDFVGTTTTSDEIATDTIIEVVSTTGMTGAPNVFTSNPLSTAVGWTTGNGGSVASVNDGIVITNGIASAGFTERTLTTIPGKPYIINITYTQTASTGAVFEIRDGTTVLDTDTLTASGPTTLEFTATKNSHTFRFANLSALIGQVSTIILLEYFDKTSGDNIGIQLDDKTRHWDNIVFVDSTIQVTINVGLPSASKSGSTAFTFSDFIERPLRISSSRRKTFGQDNEIPVESWSRNEYFKQVNKSSQGTVVNSYYSPLLTNGRYYVWQTASSVNDFVRFSFERSIEDVDLASETLDIPVEWLETVIYNLAARLGNTYSAPPQRIQLIIAEAAFFLEELLGWDEEVESLNIQPDFG